MKLDAIVNQDAGSVAKHCLLYRSAEHSDIQRPLSGKFKRSYETKRMFKSLMRYVCDLPTTVPYLLLYTGNAWRTVCFTDAACHAPKATLWSIEIRRFAALPSRHNGMSKYSDVRHVPIIPTRDIWLRYEARDALHHSVMRRIKKQTSAASQVRHSGCDGRQDARRIPKVPLRPSRILHLFLGARRKIQECAAFHVSNAFLRSHLRRNGFLKFVSDAFPAPVTRRVPDVPPLSRR
jgi:hypothetical protein